MPIAMISSKQSNGVYNPMLTSFKNPVRITFPTGNTQSNKSPETLQQLQQINPSGMLKALSKNKKVVPILKNSQRMTRSKAIQPQLTNSQNPYYPNSNYYMIPVLITNQKMWS